MLTVNDILVRISELCYTKGWSVHCLCQESGVDYTYMKNFIRGNKMISLNNLQKICKAFDISLSQFFDPKDSCNIKLKDWKVFEIYQQLDDKYKDLASQIIINLLEEQEKEKKENKSE